jgi:cytochrome c biogenesis factor
MAAGRLRLGFGAWWYLCVVRSVFIIGVHAAALDFPLAVFVAAMLVIFPGPFLLFARHLGQLKRRSLLEDGALVSEHGGLVQKR